MINNKGITLIALVITIIVIIIISSITIFYGLTRSTEEAGDTKSVYVVSSLVDAVATRTLMHKINPSYYKFVGDNSNNSWLAGDGQRYNSSDGWYYIDSQNDFDELGLDNVVGKYVVNYDLGLAVSLDGINYEGKMYYSLNELLGKMGGSTSSIIASADYDEVKKVNKPVLVNGMVPVKLVGDKWFVTTNTDPEWYDYSDKKVWANVMLKDELVVSGYANNEQVRNATLTELNGKEVTVEGSSYVWIPRYSMNGTSVIFSNLFNDVTSNGYSVPSAFSFSNIKLPGIWISKYDASLSQ